MTTPVCPAPTVAPAQRPALEPMAPIILTTPGRLLGERHDHERTMETCGQSSVAPSLDWQNAPRTASLLGCAKI
jgi:hypothetical protein